MKLVITIVVVLAITTNCLAGGFCNNCIVQQQPVVTAITSPLVVSSAVSDYATFVAVQGGYVQGSVPNVQPSQSAPAGADLKTIQALHDRVLELTQEVKRLSTITKDSVLTAEAFETFTKKQAQQNEQPQPQPQPIQENNNDIDAAAIAVLSTHCASCHTGSAPNGGIKLFEQNGVVADISPDMKVAIDYSIYSGRMPKGQPLNDSDYNTIRKWTAKSTAEILSKFSK